MLVLSRKENEKVIIDLGGGETITVVVNEIRGDKVRIGFTAPQAIRIYREELLKQKESGNEGR